MSDGFDMDAFERLLQDVDTDAIEAAFRDLPRDGGDDVCGADGVPERFPGWARAMLRILAQNNRDMVQTEDGQVSADGSLGDPEHPVWRVMDGVVLEAERMQMRVAKLPGHEFSNPYSQDESAEMSAEDTEGLMEELVHVELRMQAGDFMRLLRALSILPRLLALGPSAAMPILMMAGLLSSDLYAWADSVQAQMAVLSTVGGVYDVNCGPLYVVDTAETT